MHIDRFRVRPGDRAALKRFRSDHVSHFGSKADALAHMRKGLAELQARQELLYAQDRYAVLLVFQGMDGAGKDSAIRHVMSGVNPQGTDVHSFKAPSAEELDHDYLWRVGRALPERGRIGIFNRSHYEEVLAVRVHPELLVREQLPDARPSRRLWRQRFEDIVAFERHLARNGTVIRKFFLHVSRAEQRRRLLARLDDPRKNWKFSEADLRERGLWTKYQSAYAHALAETSREHAPWYVIPADHKWFAHVLIAEIVVRTLDGLDLAFPTPTAAQHARLQRARRQLARD
jgi:PPK2 family polyphosphate:nucleotide phosphotransferase